MKGNYDFLWEPLKILSLWVFPCDGFLTTVMVEDLTRKFIAPPSAASDGTRAWAVVCCEMCDDSLQFLIPEGFIFFLRKRRN